MDISCNGLIHSNKNVILLIHAASWVNLTDIIMQSKNVIAKKYIPYPPIYMMFKNREHQVIVKVRIMITS